MLGCGEVAALMTELRPEQVALYVPRWLRALTYPWLRISNMIS